MAEWYTFHKVFPERFTVIDFVTMSRAYTEARIVLIEVDKQHFRTDGVYTPCCKVHVDPNLLWKTM